MVHRILTNLFVCGYLFASAGFGADVPWIPAKIPGTKNVYQKWVQPICAYPQSTPRASMDDPEGLNAKYYLSEYSEFNYLYLKRVIVENQIGSVDQLLVALKQLSNPERSPLQQRTAAVKSGLDKTLRAPIYLKSSESLQKASLETPRVIYFSNYTGVIISLSLSPEDPKYHILEILQFDREERRFLAMSIDFSAAVPGSSNRSWVPPVFEDGSRGLPCTEGKSMAVQDRGTPKSCRSCHLQRQFDLKADQKTVDKGRPLLPKEENYVLFGEVMRLGSFDLRPIWEPHAVWPVGFGSVMLGNAYPQSSTSEGFNKLAFWNRSIEELFFDMFEKAKLEKERSNGKLSRAARVLLFNPELYLESPLRNTIGFTKRLYEMNNLRLTKKIAQISGIADYRYALLAITNHTEDILSYFPFSKAELASERAKYSCLKEDTRQRLKNYFSSVYTRAAEVAGTPIDESLLTFKDYPAPDVYTQKDKWEDNENIRALVDLRYVLSLAGCELPDWSLARPDWSYALTKGWSAWGFKTLNDAQGLAYAMAYTIPGGTDWTQNSDASFPGKNPLNRDRDKALMKLSKKQFKGIQVRRKNCKTI